MALAKFKVCPACGERNHPSLLECGKCETDLTGIKVADEPLLAPAAASAIDAAASGADRRLVKICDCGAANLPQRRKCSFCSEDISDVRVTEARLAAPKKMKVALCSVDRSFSFTLDKPITVIGRAAEMRQYLELKAYVSRRHAKITLANGEIYIENLSGTNPTFINNTLISGAAPALLKNGDEIGLGGKLINGERQSQAAYFVVEAFT
jgi:hypothetical protein